MASTVKLAKRLLRYGFFTDANVDEPKLLCKTIEKYEERVEKDYCETIVLMIAVGVAEPALADPKDIPPEGPPEELMTLGPLHVSEDTVVGAEECERFFPPGYSEPEHKPKPKSKKKKKKRHDTKDETMDESVADTTNDTIEEGNGEAGSADGEGEGDVEEGEGELEGDGEEEGEEDDTHVDKATSPPPTTA